MNEVSDDKRFPKKVTAGLNEVRNGTGDGLFTVSCIYAHPCMRSADDADCVIYPYRRLEVRKNTTGASRVRLHPSFCADKMFQI